MTQTQELESVKLTFPENRLSGIFTTKAKHIEGTQLCSVELPCRYRDKELIIVVYE